MKTKFASILLVSIWLTLVIATQLNASGQGEGVPVQVVINKIFEFGQKISNYPKFRQYKETNDFEKSLNQIIVTDIVILTPELVNRNGNSAYVTVRAGEQKGSISLPDTGMLPYTDEPVPWSSDSLFALLLKDKPGSNNLGMSIDGPTTISFTGKFSRLRPSSDRHNNDLWNLEIEIDVTEFKIVK